MIPVNKGRGVRIGYFDCFSGISGDMTLGALVDAGVDRRAIIDAVSSLGLAGSLSFETVHRGGFRATYARVDAPVEHVNRHLQDIEAIIDEGALTPRQKDLARKVFLRLGEAEAAAHGIELSKVHFHEVGAIDSIIDVVGASVGLDLLGVERFEASPVPPGRGWVKSAHGKMPLPAPATAELLKGVPLASSDVEMELTTPTGAAILTTVSESFGPLPAMTVESIGLGAGTRELRGQANLLRLFVGRIARPADGDRVWVLETNLDDLPGEIVGYTTTQLMASGALDAFVTPLLMKKNRPGVMISVICNEPQIPEMEEILFRETTTLGIRRYVVSRHKLRRQATEVSTRFGPVKGKLGWIEGRPPTFSPEHDDCAGIASSQNVALREVHDAAHAAYRESVPTPNLAAASTPQPTTATRTPIEPGASQFPLSPSPHPRKDARPMLVAAILAVLTLTMLAASVTNRIGHARRRAEASALLRSIEGLYARLERLEAAADAPKVPPAIPPEPVAIATTPPRRDRAVRTPFSGPTLISVPDLSRSAREAAPHIPDPALSERFKAVWDLSRAGETPEAIARATGHPVGQVELILGLRRRRPTAPRGGPRSR